MLPLLPTETHFDIARKLDSRGRSREWPDDPMYQRAVAPNEVRPDPIWMAVRASVNATRHALTSISVLRRVARSFSMRSLSATTPMTGSPANDSQTSNGC